MGTIAARSSTNSATARRRILSHPSGRAIEMLAHAIEYLADEFALECMSGHRGFFGAVHPQIAAIELLKSCNREIYLSSPLAPTFGEWIRSVLRLSRT
jgi:hypothetical protein